MVQVKVCGITNPDDARASVDAGAYALGFNFYPKSPRYIEPVQAARIIEQLPKSVLAVGVFVNESNSEAIQTAVQTAGVRAVQLHGDETPSFCKMLNGLFVIKALRVDDDFDPAEAATFETDAILLDAFGAGMYGGSGKIFDWTVAARTKPLVKKLFLAGGLNSTNVGQAIITVRPYAVDVCSGVESAPGQKDVKKLTAFMDATRKANR
jgi:phosphoribosylanthranilate isomerase